MSAIATPNATNATIPAWESASQPAPTGSFIIWMLALYVFFLSSRILDISGIWYLHLPMLFLAVLIVATLAKGDLKYAFRSKLTTWYLALNVWVCVAFPFSRWRGASVPFVISSIESFGVYLVMVQLLRTERDWRRAASGFALGMLAASIFGIFYGRSVDGRLAIASGTLADPNEFALRMVMGLPFWWYLASHSKLGGKIVYFLATVPILFTFGRAGSRSGLLALSAVFVTMFIFANVTRKAIMCVVAAVTITAGLALLPSYLRVRFTTVFTKHSASQLDERDRNRLSADIDSSEGREMLLRQSIDMTLRHPIVGVGPGVFEDVALDERMAQKGTGGGLLVSHNTYTQISSENGLPGFICFVGALFLAIKYSLTNYRQNRKQRPSISNSSFYLFVCLIGTAVGIFFLSIGYTMLLATLFAFAASLQLMAKLQTAGATALETGTVSSLPMTAPAQPSKPRANFLNGRRVRFGRFAENRSRGQ